MNAKQSEAYVEAMRALNLAVEAARLVRDEYRRYEMNHRAEVAQISVDHLERAFSEVARSRIVANAL